MLKRKQEPTLTAQPSERCSRCVRRPCRCDPDPCDPDEVATMRVDTYFKRMRAVTDRGGVWGAIQPYGIGSRYHR